MYILIFDTFIVPHKFDSLSDVQKFELERKYKKHSDIPLLMFQTINPNFSSIYSVYTNLMEVNNGELYSFDDGEKIKPFYDFTKYAERINSEKPLWIGWNVIDRDIPFIKYEFVKRNIDAYLSMFGTKRWSSYPVFDIMQELYSWQTPSSLSLTASGLGIDVDIEIADYTYLEKIYDSGDESLYREYILKRGRIITQLFEKIYKYYSIG